MGRGSQPNARYTEELSYDQSIDGLLWGSAWGNITYDLTFSFPQSDSMYIDYPPDLEEWVPQRHHFEPATLTQKGAVRFGTKLISEYTPLTFTEIPETYEQTATLRFANSTMLPGAWAYKPGIWDAAGDFWTNPIYKLALPGSYNFLAILHELGHAMGLKHGHQAEGHAGFNPGPLPPEEDHWSFSILTYRRFEGGSTGGEAPSSGVPYTYMQNDIAALQHLYGANFKTRAGDTVYKWDSVSGALSIDGQLRAVDENTDLQPLNGIIFETIWDGNGIDTYDLSDFRTDLTISLEPGAFSTLDETRLGDLDQDNPGLHPALGNIANARLYKGDWRSLIENVIGGAGDDDIKGNDTTNRLEGGVGNDTLDGGEGLDELVGGSGDDTLYSDMIDYAVFSGKRSDYLLYDDGSASIIIDKVSGRDGTDTLKGRFFGKFSDGVVILGTEEKDSQVYLDEAVFTSLSGEGTRQKPGKLKSEFFTKGDKAKSKNHFIVYDDKAYKLFYDADGSGVGEAIEIVLSSKTTITADSFLIV